ncbi:hypothetical protein SAMN05192544_103343 [Paraburkholderia hospita]|uniref:Uncharacterized protein n=1 Tax=Paraburkholderia hospita TaxID=169430 RepID=A0AAN1JNS0_9BURK|nr:hypothetical protein C2L64_52470 [Paraburkholderia hospita]SEI18953.1 hypothetical protein SAMN05192544_103343 [Paraburkholderia hospita]
MGPSRGTEVYQRCWRRRISASRSATVGESRDGQPRRYDGLEPAVEWVGGAGRLGEGRVHPGMRRRLARSQAGAGDLPVDARRARGGEGGVELQQFRLPVDAIRVYLVAVRLEGRHIVAAVQLGGRNTAPLQAQQVRCLGIARKSSGGAHADTRLAIACDVTARPTPRRGSRDTA